jgi:hypothetical protein
MSEAALKFKNLEEVRAYSEEMEKTLVILDDYVLDVSTFQCHHPGGAVLLRNKNLQAVDQEMAFHHPLSLTMANSMVVGSFKKEVSRLIDPNLPLMTQVWGLNRENYLNIINSPHWLFVPSPRMFETDFFEAFSHIKWYHILFLPCILFTYLIYRINNWDNFSPLTAFPAALAGLLLWTLIEYILHRFVFHSEQWLPDSRLVRYLHYALHGIHHMLPNDPYFLLNLGTAWCTLPCC